MDKSLRQLEREGGQRLYNARLRLNPIACPKCQIYKTDEGCCCRPCFWKDWGQDAERYAGWPKPNGTRCKDCPRKNMPTTNQLTKAPRRKKHKKPNRALQGAPQKSGVITKIKVVDPKKPNSGGRKVARVRLTNGMEVNALIPGIGLGNLQEHSHVLVIAAECPDTPSVRYKVVRGNRDAMPEEFAQSNNTVTGEQRVHGRSKYGSKKPKVR